MLPHDAMFGHPVSSRQSRRPGRRTSCVCRLMGPWLMHDSPASRLWHSASGWTSFSTPPTFTTSTPIPVRASGTNAGWRHGFISTIDTRSPAMRCFTRSSKKLVAVASAMLTAGSLLCNVAHADTVLKLAYGSEYVMVTPELTKKFWGDIKTDFEKSHPGVTVQLVPIPGGFDDIVTKVSMSYGNPSAAPDVAQLPAQEMAQWAASGYLLPLNPYLAKAAWWKDVPDAVKQESTAGKDVIGVSQGVNTSGLLYDRQVFAKAGLPADWKPKNWQDVLDAARKIKKSDPGVWPLWAITGPAGGTSALVLGAANLLMASSDPTIKDASGKWAVDTKGIREVLNFYRQALAEGLRAPSSLILNANSPALATPEFPKHHIGIALVGNYVPAAWSKSMCSPCWPDAAKSVGFAPLPTVTGGGVGYASAFGGWDVSIYKKTAHPDLAWQLI